MTIKILEEKLGKKIAAAMATAFLDDTKDIGSAIGECVTKRNAARLRELCHKLAGCCASIGDNDSRMLCRSIEDSGDNQSWDQTEATYKTLSESLEKTRASLEGYLKE